MGEEHRNLTDADVNAIVDELERRATERFTSNVGRGVLGFVWKGVMLALLWLAAYGAAGGFKKWGQ